MKEKAIGKILAIFLVIVMVLPLSAFAAAANEPSTTDTTLRDHIDSVIANQGRTPAEQKNYSKLKSQIRTEQFSAYLSSKKPIVSFVSSEIDNIRKNLPSIVKTIKDCQDGGDFDTAACIDNVVALATNLASCCGPYGQLASSIVNLGNTIFKLAMGGESSTSEMAQIEDSLTQQLDDIQDQLSNIENDINNLSNEINESTNRIINELTVAIDNADAKAYLRTFMLSGEGNFSYNQYRNYIYGTSTGNSKANTAYYTLLKQSIINDASDDITKYYYDQLYTAIMHNMNVYYDYIIGSDTGKSIVQYYYDVISSNPNLLEDDMSSELMAIMFAYDIYQTELMANQIIATCNLYQYAQMCLSGEEYYCYDQSTGKIVTLADIDGADGIDSMQDRINIRIDDIQNQLIKDIVYILNLDDSYIVESVDGNIFEVVNSDPDTYGNVCVGQTIYLNTMPEEICDLFGFDVSDFTYIVTAPTRVDGTFSVDGNTNRIEATLYYNGEELDVMSFTVGTNAKFNGGNGTASDPYLIASAAQFTRISDGLDKHYRLICDIDFNGATINPIGQKVNSNDAIVYDEFVGSLDGNGYTIKNLNIVGHTHTGLFGIIGETGDIADLKLYNVKVSANINNAEKSTSEFYSGMIAGKNNGIIKYCLIDSDGTTNLQWYENEKLTKLLEINTIPAIAKDFVKNMVAQGKVYVRDIKPEQNDFFDANYFGLTVIVNNQTHNRNIYAYTGGIAGANNYAVVGCTIANNHVSAYSTHDFGGDSTSTNKNNVYVGGVCGYSYGVIAYSVVKESVKISSYVKSIYNPQTTVNPYVVSHAGGIVAKINSLNDIYQVKSGANIICNDVNLHCESGWGEHYINCSNEKDPYVPNYSKEQLEAIVANEDVEAFIARTERNYTVTFECPDTVYEAGSDAFKTNNLKFFINGVEKEYEIVGIYGFDAQNEEFNNISQDIVVLFSVEIEGETVYFAQDITVTIKENVVTSIEILNLKDSYVKDTFSLEGLVIKYNYAVGNPEHVIINSENVSQIKYFGNITTFGTQSIVLLYNGDTVEFEIIVVCGHGNNFTSSVSGYGAEESLSKVPTCTEIGYIAYVCNTCRDVQYFYLRKTEHTPDYENAVGATDATCTEEGNTGKICCVDCGETLIDGKVIPKLNHHYVYVDSDKHACFNGSHSEYHHYTITESVKSKINADGSESWYIVYTYTCVCQKDGKIFAKEVVDENLIVDANTKLPTIMVSDGYALSADDEVVVYVQLLNNPGINAANFGIRYSEGLELISIQDGTVLKGSLVTDGLAVNYGYNFVWGNDSLFSNDGNLLKLTFRVSEYAELGDSYDISLVYAIGNGAQGGFGTSSGKQYFITKDGTIKIVERLPGDINNDGVVDLLDAIEIGQFVVGKTDSINETYANVDLSYNPDGNSNVDIMDMVSILQYITGGYGTNLLTQDFEIILNTNGYDKFLNDLLVSIYGNNNTYDEAGLAELERQGYKFLGWYDQMVGGNLIDINGDVRYNPNQKKQTLYAHWELNKLVFDANGATSGVMPDVYYTEDSNVTVENDYKKEYNVAFVSDNVKYSDKEDILKYQILYWQGSNGKQYTSLEDAVKDLMNAHDGVVTLKAIWTKSPTINYPEWLIEGYEKEISWYGNSNSSTITKINNNTDILKYTPINGYYMVYAKHTPIEYYLKFEPNGGTMTGIVNDVDVPGNGHSVANPYKFASSAKIYKTGETFSGWIDNYGNTYKEYADIGYIIGATQGTTVTLTAQWNMTEYTVTYSTNYKNDGVINSGNTSKQTYFKNSVASIINALQNIKHPDYNYNKLLGWYDINKPSIIYDLNSLKESLESDPRDVTLCAKWDLCEVYKSSKFSKNSSQTLTENRVIIDWSDLSTTDFGTLTIYTSNVSEIYFIGKSGATYKGVRLILSGSSKDMVLHFKNFNMNGYLTKSSTSTNLNVTIYCEGDNSITAPIGTTAIDNFTSLTFEGNGNMSITGGCGNDAFTVGDNGYDGAIAIIVDNLVINMTGKFNVTGGDGGAGAKGEDQSLEHKDSSAPAKATTDGGKGGNGGDAIKCSTFTASPNSQITIIGGKGGKGGNGGSAGDGYGGFQNEIGYLIAGSYSGAAKLPDGANGGNGGDGGAPINSSAKITISKLSKTHFQYGDGGDGGNGGQGADAAWDKEGVNPDTAGNGGNGGKGGAGYNGGKGGDGGKGGYSFANTTGLFANKWQYGQSGSGGYAGDGGNAISSISYENGTTKTKYGNGGSGGIGGAAGERGTKDNKHYSNAGTDRSETTGATGAQIKKTYTIIWIN